MAIRQEELRSTAPQKEAKLYELSKGELFERTVNRIAASADVDASKLAFKARNLISHLPDARVESISPKHFAPSQREALAAEHRLTLEERRKSVSGFVLSLQRHGRLSAEHVKPDGTIDTQALAKTDYFKENPHLLGVLSEHQFGRKSKTLAKARENQKQKVDGTYIPEPTRAKRTQPRERRTPLKIAEEPQRHEGKKVYRATVVGGVVAAVEVVYMSAAAAAENSTSATAQAASAARDSAIAQASAATGVDVRGMISGSTPDAGNNAAQTAANTVNARAAQAAAEMSTPASPVASANASEVLVNARSRSSAPEASTPQTPAVTTPNAAEIAASIIPTVVPEGSMQPTGTGSNIPPAIGEVIMERVEEIGERVHNRAVDAGIEDRVDPILFALHDRMEDITGIDRDTDGEDDDGSNGTDGKNPDHGKPGHVHTPECEDKPPVTSTTIKDKPTTTIKDKPTTTTTQPDNETTTTTSTMPTTTSSTSTTSTSTTSTSTTSTSTTSTTVAPTTTTSTVPPTTTTTRPALQFRPPTEAVVAQPKPLKELPRTGVSVGDMSGIALGAVAVGTVFVALGRERKAKRAQIKAAKNAEKQAENERKEIEAEIKILESNKRRDRRLVEKALKELERQQKKAAKRAPKEKATV